MRQFILEKFPDKKGLISLGGKDFKYLRQILRVKAGDMLNVRLPDGTLQNSTVASIDDKSKKIIVQICADTQGTITRGVQAEQIEAEVGNSGNLMNGIEYWLFQFLPRPQKLEQIVRQATECGVYKIVPVTGEYTEKSSIQAMEGAKNARFERIIREARQQSGSPVNTTLCKTVSIEEALEMFRGSSQAEDTGRSIGFVLSERQDGDKSISEIIKEKNEALKSAGFDGIKKICIACGCEGGISPDEVDFLVKKGLFNPIHFSVNILRCETAALYGIAAVQTGV